MRRIFYFILTIIMSLVLVSCDLDSDVKPRNQNNTKWVSENPKIYFIVAKDEDLNCNICRGKLKVSKKNYDIKLSFDFGKAVNIIDYEAWKENNYVLKLHQILVRADCKFSEEKCIIKVTESSIDGIEVGDKITFKKVEKLPDWATELVETSDES